MNTCRDWGQLFKGKEGNGQYSHATRSILTTLRPQITALHFSSSSGRGSVFWIWALKNLDPFLEIDGWDGLDLFFLNKKKNEKQRERENIFFFYLDLNVFFLLICSLSKWKYNSSFFVFFVLDEIYGIKFDSSLSIPLALSFSIILLVLDRRINEYSYTNWFAKMFEYYLFLFNLGSIFYFKLDQMIKLN